MKKSLVTGGAGFVGRHLIKRLLDEGHEVWCVDPVIENTGGLRPEYFPGYNPFDYKTFKYHPQDCRSFFKLYLDDDFDYAFHLAAIVGGRLMIENNPLAVADDLSIDAHFWQWAEKTEPQKIVCFSSSAAYPVYEQREDAGFPLEEDLISFSGDYVGVPDMSYGWAKLTCEYLAQLAYVKHGLNSICYRPFSGYGEDQDMTYPFPSICKRAIDNKCGDTLEVWGTGDQIRDFIHIEDCIDGVMETMDKIHNGGALNLSTGIGTSFKEFARMAAEEVGYSPEIVGLSDKPTGVFSRIGCTEKQNSLGFQARTPLRAGIREVIACMAQSDPA